MYRLDRKSLEKLYLSYIRSILEYSAVVFDNCTKEESYKLEKVQLAEARTVTGPKRGTSHQLLYEETKWDKLEDRRKKQKLKMFYKIKYNMAPTILDAHMPQTTAERQPYNVRSKENLTSQRARTTFGRASGFSRLAPFVLENSA